MYDALLHRHRTAWTSSLRVCMSGGAALPDELMRGFEEHFGCTVLEGYGLSETSPVASFNHPDRERKPGSIGTPIEGVEMRLRDDGHEVAEGEVGEIEIRGHNVMKGYWNREAPPEAIKDAAGSAPATWQVDEDGYYFIVDRKKDMIIRGGDNSTRARSKRRSTSTRRPEAAVVGVPARRARRGGRRRRRAQGGRGADADELQGYVKEQVAAYKYPRKVWFIDELPKGPTGKILKREIETPEKVEASAGS